MNLIPASPPGTGSQADRMARGQKKYACNAKRTAKEDGYTRVGARCAAKGRRLPGCNKEVVLNGLNQPVLLAVMSTGKSG